MARAEAIAGTRHTHANTMTTWHRDGSEFSPGRLDFIFYSGDALRRIKSFAVDTATMPAEVRSQNGLLRSDSALISDHLPLVADFAVREPQPID